MKLVTILLANVWSDRNKGDYAITLGTIKCLRKVYPNLKIIAMSMFGSNEFKVLSSEYKHLHFHVDKVVGGLYPTYFSYGYEKMPRIRQRIFDIYSFFTSLLKLILLSISKRIGLRTLQAEELMNSDLVILVGGNYINSTNLFGALFYLFRILYIAFVCIILRKPYVMLGHSIWNINDMLSKALLRFIVDRSALIVVRENLSRKILESRVGVKTKIFVLPDLGFALADEVKKRAIPHDSLTVGISVRRWNFPELRNPKEYVERYRRVISQFIKFLRSSYDARILLLPFGSGPLLIEYDILEVLEIYRRTSKLGNIHIVKMPSNLGDVFEIYCGLDFHVGVRMHSNIFAFMCGVPSIAIGYQGHKTLGMINQLGLSKYYLDISNLDLNSLIQSFEDLRREENHVREILINKTKEYHRKLFVNISALFKQLPISSKQK